MPKTKFQSIIFTALMVFCMVYCMTVYKRYYSRNNNSRCMSFKATDDKDCC